MKERNKQKKRKKNKRVETKTETMISIIGLGYVGLVTGLGFAELGHRINFVDIDATKVDKVNSGNAPIYEKGIDELLERNFGRIKATKDYSSILDSDLIFICVGTPSNPDGRVFGEKIRIRNLALY